MRILFITGEFPPMRGSIGDHTARIAAAVVARGHTVGIVTSVKAQGATHPTAQVYPVIQEWGMGAWGKIAEIARDYDLLHLEYQAGAFGMGLPMQFLADGLRLLTGGKPFLTTFHDLLVPYLFPKAGRVREWSVKHLVRASDGVVATNPDDEAVLRQWLGRTAEGRVWQIPIASPLPLTPAPDFDRTAWRETWGVTAQHKLIVHFGFLNRAKGVETLLYAHDSLLRAGQPIRLLMAGDPLGASDPSNQAYYEEILAKAAELNLNAPWLQWTGDLSETELIHAILSADVIALPFKEGANLRRSTLIMALSLGRPVVTTEPPIPIPFLESGHNIMLARRDDQADFARQLALILRYEPTLQRLERNAATLKQHFDWDVIAGQYVEAYERLVRGKG
jgi:glycosyltransferase involved in cell wall biosynthesis